MISIVTPSFRQPDWLRLCLASVADQDAGPVEHLVQDNCSGEAVQEVCARFPGVQLFQETDKGMYDAVNRGLRRASGEILAYLNCDEQYLPGALRAVRDYFDAHPDIDIVFADMVVADGKGDYVCHRKMLLPLPAHTRVCHLGVATCGTFFRRSLVERGLLFSDDWKALGDCEWMLRLLENKVSMGTLRYFTSLFTETGQNLSLGKTAREETRRMLDSAPFWQPPLAGLFAAQHRLRKLFHGIYQQEPFSYAAYTLADPEKRRVFPVDRPTQFWKGNIHAFR